MLAKNEIIEKQEGISAGEATTILQSQVGYLCRKKNQTVNLNV